MRSNCIIPEDIGQLTNLRRLDIVEYSLTGMTNLSRLTNLYLHSDDLRGDVTRLSDASRSVAT